MRPIEFSMPKPMFKKEKKDEFLQDYTEAILENLKGKFPIGCRPSRSYHTYWISKDGRKTFIFDIDTNHLINIIKMIGDGRHGKFKPSSQMYKILKEELEWREKTIDKYRKIIKPTKREDGSLFFENNINWS